MNVILFKQLTHIPVTHIPNLQENTDLVTFTKKILKSLILNFIFCAVIIVNFYSTY